MWHWPNPSAAEQTAPALSIYASIGIVNMITMITVEITGEDAARRSPRAWKVGKTRGMSDGPASLKHGA